jgi:hypothetical protein
MEKLGPDRIAPNENGGGLVQLKENVGLAKRPLADEVEKAPVRGEEGGHGQSN